MAKEQFRYDGTKTLCELVDRAGRKAGFARGQAFEDFLTCVVCALGQGLMEEEYLATVRKGYDRGEKGNRGIDYITQAFATLVALMEETRQDILGDLFEGGITYGEAGQFFTPEPLVQLMTAMTVDTEAKGEWVNDPCCGSGRMLLAYAEQKRPDELVGQDVDLRCVKMTTINLALRNLYGYVLWGNSLIGELRAGYRTGLNRFGRVVRPLTEYDITKLHEASTQHARRPSDDSEVNPSKLNDRSSPEGPPAIQKMLF